MQQVAATGTRSAEWAQGRRRTKAATFEVQDWVGAGWIGLLVACGLGTLVAFALAV